LRTIRGSPRRPTTNQIACEEILGLAHRVLVMSRGRIVTELRGEEITESAILAAAFSEKTAGAGVP